jgi:hypothetical protein
MALDVDGARWKEPGLDRLVPLDVHALRVGGNAVDTAPERLREIVVSSRLEKREDLRRSASPVRAQAHPRVRSVELVEILDERSLHLVPLLTLKPPAPLQQVREITRLPAADLERQRGARLERAAERPLGGVREPRPVEGRSECSCVGQVRESPAAVPAYRVLRIRVDRLGGADLDDAPEVQDRDAIGEPWHLTTLKASAGP